jgi:hypothetical protein
MAAKAQAAAAQRTTICCIPRIQRIDEPGNTSDLRTSRSSAQKIR